VLAPITPVVRPCSNRSPTSSSAEPAKAISTIVIAPEYMARSTIRLRPKRSPKAPHTGEASIMANAWTENTSVTISRIGAPVAEPRCST
jgi:hypothetical protein